MKKSLSLILAVLLAAAALVSCASNGVFSSTSSGSYPSYRAWLEDRVGDASDIILGTETEAAAYDLDLTGFEREGYVIRRIDGKTAIFGKTERGLDRAVREYAKHADGNFEAVYGDGQPKVGKITLAGVDISEYKIVIPADASACVRFAAENLRDYTKKACGADLAIVTEPTEHNIAFVLDDSLHEQGFVIETTEGQMTIRHGWASGALNGAMTFLEKFEGWRFVYTATNTYLGEDGVIDYVYPAENVVIPAGIDHAEEPALFSRDVYGGMFPNSRDCWGYKIKYNGGRPSSRLGNYNRHDKACHGLSTRFHEYEQSEALDELEAIAGRYPICYTDEYNIELIESAVCEFIDRRLASGWRIGMELSCVDIANYDTSSYCQCKRCNAVKNAEGSNSALILTYANVVARTVAERYSEDLYVSILAYFGSSKPPKTIVPEKNIHVSYCFYVDPGMTPFGSACGAHPFSGDGCETGKYNDVCGREFEKWCEIATYVDIWEYGDNYHPTALCNSFTLALDNIRYLADCGAYGSFWLGNNALNVALSQYLVVRDHWDPYITHDELWDMVREYCRIVYGEDCGDYVAQIYRIFDDAQRLVPCYKMLRAEKATDKFSVEYYVDNMETMFELFDRAVESAPTSALETQIKYMRCYFENGILNALWDEYTAGSEEQRAFISEHYRILYDCARETGWNGNSWDRGANTDYSFPAPDVMDFTVRPEEYIGD